MKNILFKSNTVKNISFVVIANLANMVLNAVANIKIARLLQPAIFGEYNLILTTVSFLSIFVFLGVRMPITRYIATAKLSFSKIISLIISLRLISYLITVLVFLLYEFFYGNNSNFLLKNIIILLIVFNNAVWDTSETVAFGLEKMKNFTFISTISAVGWAVAIFFLGDSYFNLHIVITIYLLFQFFKSTLFFVILFRSNPFTYEFPRFILLKEVFVESWPFFQLAIFTAFSSQIPIFILNSNSTKIEMGYFNACNKLLNPLNILIMAALNVLFPKLSQFFVKDKIRFTKMLENGIIFFLLIANVSIIFLFFTKEIIVEFLFGSKYAEVSNIIIIQSIYLVFYGLFCLIGTALGAAGEQRLLSKLSIAYAIINIPLFYYFSKYGAKGLSVSFLIGAVINITYHWYFFNKNLKVFFSKNFYLITSFLLVSLFLMAAIDS